MKIHSPFPRRRTRLEIIPLIDIMFFLLASFMMVSLQMQIIRSLKASLPTATQAVSSKKPDVVNLSVDRLGQISIEGKNISFTDLSRLLEERHKANAELPVYVSGNRDATHGSVTYVLDFVRRAGIEHVAIGVKPVPEKTP